MGGDEGRGQRGGEAQVPEQGWNLESCPGACLLKLARTLQQLSFNPTLGDTSWHQCRSNSPGHVSHQAELQVCSSGLGTLPCISEEVAPGPLHLQTGSWAVEGH